MSFKELINKLQKGGEGSGVKGHTTPKKIVNLADKLKVQTPYSELLDKLTNGAYLEGHTLRSGKPVFMDHHQAIAHGYTSEEHREAGSLHYDKAEQLAAKMKQLKDSGATLDPHMKKVVDLHRQKFRQHFAAAERVERTRKDTEAALKYLKQQKKDEMSKSEIIEKARAARVAPEKYERCVRNLIEDGMDVGAAYAHCTDKFKGCNTCACGKCPSIEKSVVMMGHQDGAEVDTSKFALENKLSQESHWLETVQQIMDGYNYGELPRTVYLPNGDLNLVKVDDGMYSGVYTSLTSTLDGQMADNVKVRIERMTLPSLVQFCMAKEWIGPSKHMEDVGPQIVENLATKLEEVPGPSVNPVPLQPVESDLDKRIRILELVSKLVQ